MTNFWPILSGIFHHKVLGRVYSSRCVYLALYGSSKIIFHFASEVRLESFDSVGNDEDNGVGLVEISEIFVMQDNCLNGVGPIDAVE